MITDPDPLKHVGAVPNPLRHFEAIQDFRPTRSASPRREVPEIENAEQANSRLGLEVLKGVRKPGENACVCPTGIFMCLAMLYEGLGPDGQKEIEDLIWPDGWHRGAVQGFVQRQLKDFEALKTCNSAWANETGRVKQDYLNVLTEDYGADVFRFDLASESESSIVGRINGWASEKTNGRIPQIMDRIDPLLILTLMNAVYFKDDWKHRFQRTEDADFTLEDGTKTAAPMMKGTKVKDTYSHHAALDCEIVEMPYLGRFAMVVVLPSIPISDFLGHLTFLRFKGLLRNLSAAEGSVWLPKFRIEKEVESALKGRLMEMGANAIFSGAADFSGITDLPVAKTDIVQKVFIDVNEGGTEAAAVTAFHTMGCGISNDEKPSFHFVADRPFLFAIRDTWLYTLPFIGVYAGPGKD
jgi:serpin B